MGSGKNYAKNSLVLFFVDEVYLATAVIFTPHCYFVLHVKLKKVILC